jgi:streptomycin 6-kinase
VHPGLEWLRGSAAGTAWLDRLPALLEECREQWSLELEEPFADAFASLAVPAGDVVLKIQFPDHESEHEAEALRVWDGDGAVRLLEHDPLRRALLLERCVPGTYLGAEPPEVALAVVGGLLPRLWKHAEGPFRTVGDEAERWRRTLPHAWKAAGRPFERELVDAALAALDDLVPTQGEQVLVHQDLHGGNVLSARREPWLVIDPKPLLAEREFGLAPLVRSVELGAGRDAAVRRLDLLTGALGLDRDRARRWTIVQTIAWSVGGDRPESHVPIARSLLQAA